MAGKDPDPSRRRSSPAIVPIGPTAVRHRTGAGDHFRLCGSRSMPISGAVQIEGEMVERLHHCQCAHETIRRARAFGARPASRIGNVDVSRVCLRLPVGVLSPLPVHGAWGPVRRPSPSPLPRWPVKRLALPPESLATVPYGLQFLALMAIGCAADDAHGDAWAGSR